MNESREPSGRGPRLDGDESPLARFCRSWDSGRTPVLEDYLSPDSLDPDGLLSDLVQADLEHRVGLGEAVRVELYLERYPRLAARRDDVRRLIITEFRHRRHRDAGVTVTEYLSRFPQFQEDLARELSDTGEPASTRDLAETDAGATRVLEGGPAAVVPSLPTVAGYTLRRVLGRGGMGVVYEAYQEKLQRGVALKMIRGGVHAGPEELGRFRAEAQAVARLQHPNIVQIYEVGEHADGPYFSLEFVDGGSLERALAGVPQLARSAAALMEKLARAVQVAHQHGIVHRDLKPANVLLTVDGEPKIADFGLAKRLDDEVGQTRTGAIMGTPSYMAPEQAAGRSHDIGPGADVYALGAILYEMLTGRPPFRGTTVLETLEQVRRDEPVAPGRLRPGLPRDLETICLKCLQKQPRQRYAQASDLAEDLRRFQAGEPIAARPTPAWERAVKLARRHPTAAALSSFVCAAISLLMAVIIISNIETSRQRDDAVYHKNVADDKSREAERRRREADQALARSHDLLVRQYVANGNRLADDMDHISSLHWFVEALALDRDNPDDATRHRIRIAAALAQTPRLIGVHTYPRTIHETGGDGVVTLDAKHAMLWNGHTGKLQAQFEGPGEVSRARLSPDGRYLALDANNVKPRFWQVDPPKRLDSPIEDAVVGGILAFGPRPGWMACYELRALFTVAVNVVRVWDLNTGQPVTKPLPHPDVVGHATFSPDGRYLLTKDVAGKFRVWDIATSRFLGLFADVPPQLSDVGHQVCFSNDGATVLLPTGRWEVRVFDTATQKPVSPPLRHAGMIHHGVFSPDGSIVATVGYDYVARLWNTRTGQTTQTFRHAGPVVHGAFSPDGRHFATAAEDQTARVWDVQSGAPLTPPLKHESFVYRVEFRDGGRRLQAYGRESTRLWELASTAAGAVALVHGHSVNQAAFCLGDARMVTASGDHTAQLWDADHATPVGPPLRHMDSVNRIWISPDGRGVITDSHKSDIESRLRAWDAASGKPLGPSFTSSGKVFDVAFVGKRRLLVVHESTADNKAPHGLKYHAQLRDLDTGQPQGPPLWAGDYLTCGAFSADGRVVAVGASDGTVHVFQTESGKPLCDPLRLATHVERVALSPDGTRVAAAVKAEVHVWNLPAGRAAFPPIQHRSTVNVAVLTFSADGRRLLTATGWPGVFNLVASPFGEARVFNADTGDPMTPPLRHRNGVLHASFSADQRFIATASQDRTARVWDAHTGEPLTPGLPHDSVVTTAILSADARFLLTSSPDGAARRWPLQPEEAPLEELQRLAKLLAAQQVDASGGFVPMAKEIIAAEWRDLHARHPQWLQENPHADREWHERQAHAAEAGEQHAAVVYHLTRLLRLDPRNAEWLARRGQARLLSGDGKNALDDVSRAVELAPDFSAARLARAFVLAELGRKDDSDADYAQVVERGHIMVVRADHLWPENEDVPDMAARQRWLRTLLAIPLPAGDKRTHGWRHRHAGLRFAYQGLWEDAAREYGEAAASDANDGNIQWELAFAQAMVAENEQSFPGLAWDKVDVSCTRALAVHPRDWRASYLRGLARLRQDKAEPAAADFTKAIDDGATGWALWGYRGSARKGMRKFADAISDLSEAIRRGGREASVYFDRGESYLRDGDSDQAIADLSAALRLRPRFVEALNCRGWAYNNQGKHDEAIRDLNEAIRLDPRHAWAHNNRGVAQEGKGNLDAALADYSRAIALNERLHLPYNNRGLIRSTRKDYARAIEDFTAAIKVEWDFTPAYRNRAFAYGRLERYGEAIEDLDRVISRTPRDAWALRERGWAYNRKGEPQSAVDDLTRALAIEPNAWTYRERGLAHERLGEMPQASADYDRAIKLAPDDAWAYQRRGEVGARQSKWSEASADFARAIERDPNDVESWRCLALTQLHADDRDGYRETCGRVRKHFAGSADQAGAVAWILLLRRGEETSPIVELARTRLADPPTAPQVLTLAAALYRHGDGAAALKQLDQMPRDDERDLMAHVLRGLALRRAGKPDQARDLLQPLAAKITDRIDKERRTKRWADAAELAIFWWEWQAK